MQRIEAAFWRRTTPAQIERGRNIIDGNLEAVRVGLGTIIINSNTNRMGAAVIGVNMANIQTACIVGTPIIDSAITPIHCI